LLRISGVGPDGANPTPPRPAASNYQPDDNMDHFKSAMVKGWSHPKTSAVSVAAAGNFPPTAQGDQDPDGFHKSEGPRIWRNPYADPNQHESAKARMNQ
jgi:hypothetical protein